MTEDRPPRASSLIATVTGAVAVGFLFHEITTLIAPVLMGVVGILCLAACFESTVHGETSPGRGFVLGLLTIPVGIGFVGGVFGTTLLLVGVQFPVPSSPQISVGILWILGGLGIVVGCTTTLFGLVLGRRDILDEPSLRTYTKIAFVTASAPVLVGLGLFVRVALGASQSLFGQILSQSVRIVFSPTPTQLHLGSFLFVLTVAGVSVLLFFRQVPVADLLIGDGGRSGYRRVASIERGLQVGVTAAALVMIPVIAVEAAVPPTRLESTLGSGRYALIQAVTTAEPLRFLLSFLTVITLGWIAIDSVLRQWTAWSDPGGSQWLGPFVAGSLLAVTAAAFAEQVFNLMLTEVTTRLPTSLAVEIQNRVMPVVSVYGEIAVIVLFAGVLVALAAWIGLSFWLAVYFGYLTGEGAGFAIAGGGLFFGAVGAVIQGAPAWVVLGVIVASLLVWDIGTFGTELGREVGAGETRGVELVHAGATLAMGVGAGVAGFVLLSVAPDSLDPSPTATLALVCLGGGVLALSLALRGSVVR